MSCQAKGLRLTAACNLKFTEIFYGNPLNDSGVPGHLCSSDTSVGALSCSDVALSFYWPGASSKCGNLATIITAL